MPFPLIIKFKTLFINSSSRPTSRDVSLSRSRIKFGMTFVLLALSILMTASAQAKEKKWYTVEKVLSGDRIQLHTGTVIQYAAIAAPDIESKDERILGYAEESKEYNRQLVEGKKIYVEWGPNLKNKKGLYTPFVFLEDGTHVNLKLLEAGYVKLDAKPPFSGFIDELRDTARLSRFRGEGLWIHEDENRRRIAVIGNINTDKYYHPDDPELDGVPKPQLREFGSVVEAKAAGYKPSYEFRQRNQQVTKLY